MKQHSFYRVMEHGGMSDDPFWQVILSQTEIEVRNRMRSSDRSLIRLRWQAFNYWGWEYRDDLMPYREYPL